MVRKWINTLMACGLSYGTIDTVTPLLCGKDAGESREANRQRAIDAADRIYRRREEIEETRRAVAEAAERIRNQLTAAAMGV